MSNTPTKSGLTTRAPMPAFGTFGTPQASASLLLEKSNPGLRRSTPDSEALASSDDEAEHAKTTATTNVKTNRPVRRTSWLNDVSLSNANRKSSITVPYSPSTSLPGTPGSEQSPWTSISTSGAAAWHNPATAYPWPNIWTQQDGRKEPPARLQEVLPSNGDGGIPFSIPLQPTPKTYRSQSYSVGQLDTTSAPTATNAVSTSTDAPRNRLAGQYPSLQRRTSRTSGLGTMDSSGLGRLREVEDDEEDVRGSMVSDAIATEQARMIEILEKENAQLRHAAQNRDRTFSATSATTQPPPSSGFRNTRLRSAVPEEAETAIDDREDLAALGGFGGRENNARRMSEQPIGFSERQTLSSLENRNVEGVKKPHWQTSLGFGPIPEAPQSRRHSFADVPTRHGSFSSNDDMTTYETGSQAVSQGEDPVYFNTTESTRRAADARVHQSHRDPQNYGSHLGMTSFLDSGSQPLFIVNFKCCRSDVFYIQEGTGLHVSVGDLVIVEADRGTDLGTVQHTNVTWEDARRYKEYYAEEHYKWLMMFSLQSRNGGPNVVNPNGVPGRQGSAVGGMGPQGHHGPHDASHPDLKPKLIKRLAQNHEIQALKDKEGNEAKAKRVCQQKVIEHRLNMEILDAEFQMDSKKLTFYYFADNYINFNHLVTDLFKIYKTRIWMSAINPASFQTPTASLGITPVYSAAPGDERHRRRQQQQQQQQVQGQPQQPHSLSPQAITTPFGDTFDADRTFNNQNQGPRNSYYNQFQDVGAGPQPGMAPYANMPGQMDPFMPFYGQPYPALNPNAPNFANNRPEFRGRGPNQPGDVNWMGRFQGLSLGS
ncbi:uncharacterized protein Z518_09054 [Rhinocladiella mackenziei CBS 650.93]|uniref:Rhinocladiella mackenziei CBS 650.93 unplaced genomic scaffold supercont1.7, whole genome shotgun sequence n=1 Tax=Rhinocladiella mackenziei CBS 650.93 TaxID=1442369 RepID=A0A0D2I698_9EURO|nr:uncharacterized protein Z518_09054 [Rhinocladiella mackenziei CBS 650.93]KIX01329.1 hypothetical protein Z518_09054 [Rhinocladiella mackenziei CBS 650.93]